MGYRGTAKVEGSGGYNFGGNDVEGKVRGEGALLFVAGEAMGVTRGQARQVGRQVCTTHVIKLVKEGTVIKPPLNLSGERLDPNWAVSR
jgi:hypothetical protein